MGQINKNLIAEKSDTVIRCLERVRRKKPQTKDLLLADIDAQDIIILNLERAIQACVDVASHIIAYTPLPIAPTMADAFIQLHHAGIIPLANSERMRKAVGLRNLLVHEYKSINWDIVWSVLERHLNDPVEFLNAVDAGTAKPI